jgi:predicted permease
MFDPAVEDAPGAQPSMVIGNGLWQRRFAGDPAVIGRTIRLNKKAVTIIGVTPYALATLGGQDPDIWLAMPQQPYFVDNSKVLKDFNDSSVRMWGRLAPGVSAKSAEQELRSLTNELRRQHPSAVWDKEFIQSSPGGHLQVMQPEMYQVAAMAAVLTLLILAVACGNLGALLLVRALQREREMGIRLAIGAGRWRIFRQLCTESLLLAGVGAMVGLALGGAIMQITLRLFDAPKWLSAAPDVRVLLFTVGMTFLSAIFFGLAPALQVARQRQHKTTARQILIAAQVAGSCVLLIVSGLLVRAAQHALYTDPGFGYERLVSVDPQLAQHGYHAGAAKAYLDQMQTRLLTVPGVRSVSQVLLPPLGHTVSREDRETDGHRMTVYPNWVSPGFFQTMQIPMLLGRTFSPGDKNVVIVSQSFARAQWPGQNPLGKRVGDDKHKDTVIGMVGDAHLNALNDDDATEQYWPVSPDQMPGMVLIVRMAGAVESLPIAAKSISDSIDPKLFPEIRRIKSLYRDNVLGVERVAGVLTLIGLVAVTLAGVGVLGLVSFTVGQRTKEIGIRMALGARRGHVLTVVLQQFFWPVLSGLLIGTGCAAAASQILRRALYGISNLDPLGYGGAIGTLLLILAIAALLPARHALRINLAKALHYE